MTNPLPDAFDELLRLAKTLGIAVRHARLGGAGGGLATVRHARQLFVDLDADPAEQLEQTARALGTLVKLRTIYIRPDLRRLMGLEIP